MWWYAAAASVVIILGLLFLLNPAETTPDTILASTDKVTTVPLEDGSQVSIDAGGTITYNKASIVEGAHRKVFLEGQAFFEVNHEPERPFIVTTPDAEIIVLGTKFMVKTFDNAPTKVLVIEGKVRVNYLHSKKELILEAEQETNIEEESTTSPAVKPSDDNQLYWKTGVMTFQNASLAQVLQTLSKEFGTPISAQNDQILSCMITATFKKQSLETILEVIKSTHQLDSKQEDDTIVIFGNGCN